MNLAETRAKSEATSKEERLQKWKEYLKNLFRYTQEITDYPIKKYLQLTSNLDSCWNNAVKKKN